MIFSIPRDSVLNLNTGLRNPQLKPLEQAILTMPNWLVRISFSFGTGHTDGLQALTVIIISESLLNNSKWTPYFAVLPRQLNSLVFWSESELAGLQASAVVGKIGKEKAEEMFSQHIAPLGLRNYDLETCHRVASIIMAYAFDIPEKNLQNIEDDSATNEDEGEELVSDDEEEEKTILSMIPLADMLNADADRNNARLCCDNVDLEMRTIKPIRSVTFPVQAYLVHDGMGLEISFTSCSNQCICQRLRFVSA